MVNKLQELPNRLHWALADEALLQAVARSEPMERGILGRQFGTLVRWTSRAGLVWPLLTLVSMQGLFRLLIGQRAGLSKWERPAGYPKYFFVGFGAGSEEPLYQAYCGEHAGTVAHVNQIDISTLGSWHRVGVVAGLRSLAHTLGLARQAVVALPPEMAPWRADFLTHVGMRAGYFAFMHAWFGVLKQWAGDGLGEVAFLSADTAAFAAVDVGLPCGYIQHGMSRWSTLVPAFARIEALTADEARAMREALPCAKIIVRRREPLRFEPADLSRGVLVASIYGVPDSMHRIDPLIAWAAQLPLPVWVRPHPCETPDFWEHPMVDGQMSIESRDSNFFQALARLRPRLVASWFSTALADALGCGIIPVTVCADDDIHVADMVYPLFKRSLRWPADTDLIERLLDDDGLYVETLARLREGWESVPA